MVHPRSLLHHARAADLAFLQEAWPSLERALLWLRYQDSNECGLLEVHEAMDWADLFANRYNVLYDNVLYYAAWKAWRQMAQALDEMPADTSTARLMCIARSTRCCGSGPKSRTT